MCLLKDMVSVAFEVCAVIDFILSITKKRKIILPHKNRSALEINKPP